MNARIFVIILWLVIAIEANADDLPYVFGDDGRQLISDDSLTITYNDLDESDGFEYISDSDLTDSDVIEFTTEAAPNSGQTITKSRDLESIKNEINDRVDVENPTTRNAAVAIASKFSGEYNIDQISSIYEYVRSGWHYVNDPRGVDYYAYASESLINGKSNDCVGSGDCDDFAILMAAMIESIGGTTRIILAYNKNQGHAYTEVYLGSIEDPTNNQVNDSINWLKSEYNTRTIYTHIESGTQDVWLNLDWGSDDQGNFHPGGPFFKSDKTKILLIREQYSKVAPILLTGHASTGSKLGTLKGCLLDEDGNPLIGKVVVTDKSGDTQLAVTDKNGNYELALNAGSYKVTAEKNGYDFEVYSVNIDANEGVDVRIKGNKQFEIDTGITLGQAFDWSDDSQVSQLYS